MNFIRRSGRLNPSANYNQNQNTNMNMNMGRGGKQANPMYSGYNSQQNSSQYQRRGMEPKSYQTQGYTSSNLGNSRMPNLRNHKQKEEIEEVENKSYNPPQQQFKPQMQTQPQPPIQSQPAPQIQFQQPQREPEPEPEPEIKLQPEPENKIQANEPPTDVSATTKALKMEGDGTEKKRFKKGVKTPLGVRKKRLNERLSRVLTPKNAMILLHELRPGCAYKIQGESGVHPPVFTAFAEQDGKVLGMGQGMSKSQAKNTAAENAIKAIVSKAMAKTKNPSEEQNESEKMDEDKNEETPESLPWAGLASFAMYKMFTEWQNQGTELPLRRPVLRAKKVVEKTSTLKPLPPNASTLHPTVLLNMMKPGLIAVEMDRQDTPVCRVTMGYNVDGKTYTGVGGNKKDAKKEAAKAVLGALYGLTYPS